MWIVFYKSYGQWRCTSSMWKTNEEAQRHAELYIIDTYKKYNTNVEYLYIPQMED